MNLRTTEYLPTDGYKHPRRQHMTYFEYLCDFGVLSSQQGSKLEQELRKQNLGARKEILVDLVAQDFSQMNFSQLWHFSNRLYQKWAQYHDGHFEDKAQGPESCRKHTCDEKMSTGLTQSVERNATNKEESLDFDENCDGLN
ncbi:unnamed protein product [Moneuplotes crassus]|uniref:Uncharacterized protein n=1 Tax=Euplotes crassus TaxID=5936 RepID=A0AAD2D149_EUPCR|nr:unnamed protein product [Moneuplotes crassus]